MALNQNKSSIPETKRLLLDASVKLMLARGFTATTVDQICAEAGVTKGSFFHYFKTKEELAKATATYFSDFQQRFFDEAAFRSLDDPLDRIHGRLDLLVSVARNPQMPKSCVIGNLSQEVSDSHPEIRCVCDAAFTAAAADFERDLAQATAKYVPNSALNPASLARLYLALIQGSLILAKAAQNASILEENVEHFRRYLETFFGQRGPRAVTS